MNLTDNEKRDIVKYIEVGVTKKPSVFVVAKIVKKLGISIDDLLS